MDFLRPGLKTGVGNGIFWSEIGSGFGDTGGTPHQKFQRVPLYKVYRYVPPQRVWFLSRFGLKMGIDFEHFGL